MNIQNIFTNFVAHEFLDLDNKSIEECCYKLFSNCRFSQYNLNLEETELQPLYKIVRTRFNELHKHLGFTDNTNQKLYNAWININNNHNIDAAHCHARKFFTAVYYVKSSKRDAGELKLLTPNPVLAHVIPGVEGNSIIKTHNEFNSASWKIYPEAGKLVIFPSWLVHQVMPNRSKVDRISIAFNSRIEDQSGSNFLHEY